MPVKVHRASILFGLYTVTNVSVVDWAMGIQNEAGSERHDDVVSISQLILLVQIYA